MRRSPQWAMPRCYYAAAVADNAAGVDAPAAVGTAADVGGGGNKGVGGDDRERSVGKPWGSAGAPRNT